MQMKLHLFHKELIISTNTVLETLQHVIKHSFSRADTHHLEDVTKQNKIEWNKEMKIR